MLRIVVWRRRAASKLTCLLRSDLPGRARPVFVQVVSSSVGWSPLSSFLVVWSTSGDARGSSMVFEAVDMPSSGPLNISRIADYVYHMTFVHTLTLLFVLLSL